MNKGDLKQSLSKFPLQKSACWALDNSRGVVDLSMIAYTGFASNFWIKGGPQFLSKCSAFFHFLCKPLDSYLQCTERGGTGFTQLFYRSGSKCYTHSSHSSRHWLGSVTVLEVNRPRRWHCSSSLCHSQRGSWRTTKKKINLRPHASAIKIFWKFLYILFKEGIL